MRIPRNLPDIPRTIRYVRAAYFIGDKFLGSSWDYVLRTNGGLAAVWLRPMVYFCPYCGEIWARKVYEREANLPTDWFVEEEPCEYHGSGLLLTWSYASNEYDKSILLRELSLLMKGRMWIQ